MSSQPMPKASVKEQPRADWLLNHESTQNKISQAVLKLDAWLDSMRTPEGYGGPVAHWWQSCLQYTGAGLDWRYEGIIIGYLTLYQKTGHERWLAKARRAGDDLVRGQLSSGNFRNSCFEANPYPGGTPHEAACDLALLRLATLLRQQDDPAWERYAKAAELNLNKFVLEVLWDQDHCFFRNTANDGAFVPNKAATTTEALLAWASLSGRSELIEQYVLPTLDRILQSQVHGLNDQLDGAIEQAMVGQKGTGRYFPFYIARCIPALVEGYKLTKRADYLNGTQAAMSFIMRTQLPDGSFPQVLYRDGESNRYPQWIAAVGDILRAMEVMQKEGMDVTTAPTLRWLLKGQQPAGGIRTATGFAAQASQRSPYAPDFRDILPVCGWVDKAFRYLSSQVREEGLEGYPEIGENDYVYLLRGQVVKIRENRTMIEVWHKKELLYKWQKGSQWAERYIPRGGIL